MSVTLLLAEIGVCSCGASLFRVAVTGLTLDYSSSGRVICQAFGLLGLRGGKAAVACSCLALYEMVVYRDEPADATDMSPYGSCEKLEESSSSSGP